jgi:hypothetical protein
MKVIIYKIGSIYGFDIQELEISEDRIHIVIKNIESLLMRDILR